eukprot:CAMPEP_0185913552 /NCGR_PEP_ID=MMETSP0924C-20121207/292_1 /TAXON_ID=321610 /ORGANISM="Perkinsus chesapeaki, Strain ATCC PRA-65" /LENGTH=81 /DNA_ID=CAMNT_0028635203 /DNA_START=24 /DNA_END=266 /DNA_ORIENTATION=-
MPIQRLSEEDFAKARKYAEEERAELKQTPTKYLSRLESGEYPYNTIEDYHKVYINKSQTPTQVIKRVLNAVAELNPTLKAI